MSKDQRRFPRVQMQIPFGEVFRTLGARVVWPNFEISDIVDLSYKGLAVKRPGVFVVKMKDVVKLTIELGDENPYECFGRAVWSSVDIFGFEITSLSPTGHLALRKFLDDSLLGQNLRKVEMTHYNSQSNFNYWFQAGSACHVFLWVDGDNVVERVQVDFDGEKVDLSRGQSVRLAGPLFHRALRVLTQLKDETVSIDPFIKELGKN